MKAGRTNRSAAVLGVCEERDQGEAAVPAGVPRWQIRGKDWVIVAVVVIVVFVFVWTEKLECY